MPSLCIVKLQVDVKKTKILSLV